MCRDLSVRAGTTGGFLQRELAAIQGAQSRSIKLYVEPADLVRLEAMRILAREAYQRSSKGSVGVVRDGARNEDNAGVWQSLSGEPAG